MAVAPGDCNRQPTVVSAGSNRDGLSRVAAGSRRPFADLSIFNVIAAQTLVTVRYEQYAMSRTLHRKITDDLLSVAVRIKRDAGVGHADIQAIIDRFACQEIWQERTGGIGFPLVEDIPESARGQFLAMLSDLVPHADRPAARMPVRGVSVKEIWPSRID